MLMIANDTGCIWTDAASGCNVVPTMMIAGMASRKQPTTRNTNTMKNPTPICPIPQAVTFSSSALGIWK